MRAKLRPQRRIEVQDRLAAEVRVDGLHAGDLDFDCAASRGQHPQPTVAAPGQLRGHRAPDVSAEPSPLVGLGLHGSPSALLRRHAGIEAWIMQRPLLQPDCGKAVLLGELCLPQCVGHEGAGPVGGECREGAAAEVQKIGGIFDQALLLPSAAATTHDLLGNRRVPGAGGTGLGALPAALVDQQRTEGRGVDRKSGVERIIGGDHHVGGFDFGPVALLEAAVDELAPPAAGAGAGGRMDVVPGLHRGPHRLDVAAHRLAQHGMSCLVSAQDRHPQAVGAPACRHLLGQRMRGREDRDPRRSAGGDQSVAQEHQVPSRHHALAQSHGGPDADAGWLPV